MAPHSPPDVTELLLAVSAGDREALHRLMPLVYEELRRIARRQLSRERPDHTLDSVALVNEAYLKLVDQTGVRWENRAHFFAHSARAMRTILVDYARARNAAKRGGGASPATLDEEAHGLSGAGLSDGEARHLVALDDALNRLAEVDAEASRTVECRYFGGLSLEEAALALDLSVATLRRRWAFAKAWLRRELQESA